MAEDDLVVNDYVVRINSDRQIGRIIAFDGELAVVLWGVQDQKVYTENIAVSELKREVGQKDLEGKPLRKNIFE